MNGYIQYDSTSRLDKCSEFVMIRDMTNKLELATNHMEVMGFLTDHVYLQVKDRKSGTPVVVVHDKNILAKAIIQFQISYFALIGLGKHDFDFSANAKTIKELYLRVYNTQKSSEWGLNSAEKREVLKKLKEFSFYFNRLVTDVTFKKFENKHNVNLRKMPGAVGIFSRDRDVDLNLPLLKEKDSCFLAPS